MKVSSKIIISITLLFSLLVGLSFPNPADAAVLGSATDNGITLTIDNCSLINDGQELSVSYTIYTKSNRDLDKNAASLIENPHIWIGDTLVRADSVSHSKVGKNEYKGSVVAQLHQYRPAQPHVIFKTKAILNQKGLWAIDFILKNA